MAISKEDILEAVGSHDRYGTERPGQGIRREVRRFRRCRRRCRPGWCWALPLLLKSRPNSPSSWLAPATRRLKVIKVVRAHRPGPEGSQGSGRWRARSRSRKALPRPDAEALKKQLEDAGAKVEVK